MQIWKALSMPYMIILTAYMYDVMVSDFWNLFTLL